MEKVQEVGGRGENPGLYILKFTPSQAKTEISSGERYVGAVAALHFCSFE